MKKSFYSLLTFFIALSANAALPPGDFTLSAGFSPSSVQYGQSSTFTWRASNPDAFCSITGVPGITEGGASGSYTFNATLNLTARVSCEVDDTFRVKSANLIVSSGTGTGTTPPEPLPAVQISYSSNYVRVGEPVWLNWSSQNATTCAGTSGTSGSSDFNLLNGVQGSILIYPTKNLLATITCSGKGGVAQNTASLNVLEALKIPTVSLYASSTYLSAPEYVTFSWNSQNVTSCNYPFGSPSGSTRVYVAHSQLYSISCFGMNGTATAQVYVNVLNPTSNSSNLTASPPRLPSPDIGKLGIDLNKNGMEFRLVDLNSDGILDMIAVDSAKREAYILLARKKGFVSVDKYVKDIGSLKDIESIFVPKAVSNGIRVSIVK